MNYSPQHRRALFAGILSFLLPGLGLWYLGFRKAAVINFSVVVGALILLAGVLAEPTLVEHVHYLFLGFAALSAGYAHGVGTSPDAAVGGELPTP